MKHPISFLLRLIESAPRMIALFIAFAACSAWAADAPIILTGADRRPALSLDGDWATIVDPYFSGLFSFHHEEKKNGFFVNRKALPGDPFPTEYDFSKAPKLKVPGDWNTQRESLFFYEGPIWYERDFTYQPKEHTRVFLHVGAANYKSWFWVNGQKVCEHEGGYTSFNCEVTAAIHAGGNFIVAAVDNTRREDNVPTLETDWWNYGGLTRSVSLIEVPETFIDQYDVHLSRTEDSVIEGWVHFEGPLGILSWKGRRFTALVAGDTQTL
jgi:beta-glucuronidase